MLRGSKELSELEFRLRTWLGEALCVALFCANVSLAQNAIPSARKIVRDHAPKYPKDARKRKLQGIVTFRLTVAPDGRVAEASLLSGDPILADAAKMALLETRYAAQPSESQVEASICFLMTKEGPISFRIDDPDEIREFAEALKRDPEKPGVMPPLLVYAPGPRYTSEARRDKVEGVCILAFLVDERGSARHPIVMRRLGDGLDENAVAMLKQWKFQPAIENGQPIPFIATSEMAFHLSED